jgi:hypothetical protein
MHFQGSNNEHFSTECLFTLVWLPSELEALNASIKIQSEPTLTFEQFPLFLKAAITNAIAYTILAMLLTNAANSSGLKMYTC